jgi:rare lipoprotein A (peptidoglycan hydrolase)
MNRQISPSHGYVAAPKGANLFNLGDSCCNCVRLLRVNVEASLMFMMSGRLLLRLFPVVMLGGFTACGQMEGGGVGMSSMEIKPEASSAYNYGSSTGAASAGGPVGAIQPAYHTSGNAPQVVASYATTTGAPTASPGLSRSLVVPARLQESAPRPQGGFKVGQPYNVDGTWYTPKHDKTYSKVGLASWYGPDFHGKRTANGEIYDMNGLTAAHQTLPMPCYARVTNIKNGRTVVVRINDRGPFKHQRIIDLSGRAAEMLGFQKSGVAPVKVDYVGLAPVGEIAQAKPAAGARQASAKSVGVIKAGVGASQ